MRAMRAAAVVALAALAAHALCVASAPLIAGDAPVDRGRRAPIRADLDWLTRNVSAPAAVSHAQGTVTIGNALVSRVFSASRASGGVNNITSIHTEAASVC